MRHIRTGLAVGALLTLGVGGLVGSASSAMATTGDQGTTGPAPVVTTIPGDMPKFVQCLKRQGATVIKRGDGKIQVKAPAGMSVAKAASSFKRCEPIPGGPVQVPAPGGTKRVVVKKASPAEAAKLRKFARCLQAHGIPGPLTVASERSLDRVPEPRTGTAQEPRTRTTHGGAKAIRIPKACVRLQPAPGHARLVTGGDQGSAVPGGPGTWAVKRAG